MTHVRETIGALRGQADDLAKLAEDYPDAYLESPDLWVSLSLRFEDCNHVSLIHYSEFENEAKPSLVLCRRTPEYVLYRPRFSQVYVTSLDDCPPELMASLVDFLKDMEA